MKSEDLVRAHRIALYSEASLVISVKLSGVHRQDKAAVMGIKTSTERIEAMKEDRDVEKGYSTAEFISKLRRLADALESGEKFEIQIAGERIYVPVRAIYNIEHEREGSEEEIEFQIKWSN